MIKIDSLIDVFTENLSLVFHQNHTIDYGSFLIQNAKAMTLNAGFTCVFILFILLHNHI